MHATTLALACLACVGHLLRGQSQSEELQGGFLAKKKEDGRQDVLLNLNPLKAFTKLLFAFNPAFVDRFHVGPPMSLSNPSAKHFGSRCMLPLMTKKKKDLQNEDYEQDEELDLESDEQLEMERTFSVRELVEMSDSFQSALPTDVVVKILGTGVRPSYLQPWQVLHQKSWTGTGFVIQGRRILTNAHVVQDQVVLQVQKQDNPHKFRAKVLCVAHDIDLAIVDVEEDGFWDDLPHASFAYELPDLYSEVKVVGFPTGGATVCVTKGIVSRVDAQVYVHPRILGLRGASKNSPEILILQIDAAINPGNSGGPAFDKNGKVLGIASSGMPKQQNIGYIIPSVVAQNFIDEFDATGNWSGVSEAGFDWKILESAHMRSFLKMGNETGVLVLDVAPMGALADKLQPGDIITHIDGLAVTNEGEIRVVASGHPVFLDMAAQITKKAKGEITELRILREGEAMQMSVCFHPVPTLSPRFHGYDVEPDFVLIGGLVFTRGSVPLKRQYFDLKSRDRPPMDLSWRTPAEAFKQDPDHEIVLLLSILKHDVNIGYDVDCLGALDTFNEKKVRNLAELARFYGECMRRGEDEYLRFCIDHPAEGVYAVEGIPDIVLLREKVEAADREISEDYQLSDIVSEAMRPYFQGEK